MDNLQVSYELSKLSDILDERKRLQDLQIKTSNKDNLVLKQQLNKILDSLNEIDVSSLDSLEEFNEFQKNIETYNEIVRGLSSQIENSSIYVFNKEVKYIDNNSHNHNNESSRMFSSSSNKNINEDNENAEGDYTISDKLKKKVRFNDELSFTNNNKSENNMTFQPYHDYEDSPNIANDSSTNIKNNIINSISSQELFATQQQQLMDQDNHLNSLSQSVRNQHNISLDINAEVEQQNNVLLSDLENLIDNSGRNLQRARRRLDIFERSAKENGPCTTIVILIIILFLLLILL